MNRKIHFLIEAIKNPIKVIRYIFYLVDNRFQISEAAKVRERGERLVIKNWQYAKSSKDFATLAHIQRYEWISPHVKGLKCLDAGCGSGYGTYYLAKSDVESIVGIDISKRAIEFAKKRYNEKRISYLQMDVRNLRFEDKYFDIVISFDVLEHLEEDSQQLFLSEVARVLNDNGVLYIGCPNATVSIGDNPHHLRELTEGEFELLLNKYFEHVRIFGQDILKNARRQKKDWHKFVKDLSYQDLIIVEEDCGFTYGLLGYCRRPKNRGKNPKMVTMTLIGAFE